MKTSLESTSPLAQRATLGLESRLRLDETPAGPAPLAKAPTAAEKRKYQLKVDGQDIEEELSDDDIRVRLQKAHAVDKRFAEVANQRKQIEAALSQLKNDPAKALKEIAGLDLDEWAEALKGQPEGGSQKRAEVSMSEQK
jgi:hypothetical protein